MIFFINFVSLVFLKTNRTLSTTSIIFALTDIKKHDWYKTFGSTLSMVTMMLALHIEIRDSLCRVEISFFLCQRDNH
jgi:hypothetical protein